jgi:hypothetical protein
LTNKLIIFDYSGTLSLEMAAFARPDNLIKYLKKSGLSALGVESVALFREIINSTWTKGSTSRLGYKKVMEEGIREKLPETTLSGAQDVSNAVSDFVDAYFEHSRIDDKWRPVLERLSKNISVQVIIATDHYVEATSTIIKFLGEWLIKAAPLTACRENNFAVANSADLGFHKADKRFWEIIKNDLQSGYRYILLIDDFGRNEQLADNYSSAGKIEARRKSTIEVLHDVFDTDVECFSFAAGDRQREELIASASAAIDRFLSA